MKKQIPMSKSWQRFPFTMTSAFPSTSRRRFIGSLAAAALLASRPHRLRAEPQKTEPSPQKKPPYRLLYNNDCTNILSCTSPWHPRGAALTADLFAAAVDESADAGAEAHFFQPGLCWVPWWPSKVLPLEQHVRWFKERLGPQAKPDAFSKFVLDGGDPVKITLDRCRECGIGAFISFRLNDAHNKSAGVDPDNPKTARMYCTPRFYSEHPEYRFGDETPKDWPSYAKYLQNWTIPEVREFKYRIIEELCENYELDGIELDFMRHPYFFPPDRTSSEERRKIMGEFVGRVRKVLDRTAREKRRWLCVRIPAYLDSCDALGIDLKTFAEAGVEMFNLSSWFIFEQMTDAAAMRAQIPDRAMYQELTNTPYVAGKKLSAQRRSDNYSYRRATDAQLYTTAHLAYSRGLDGVSLFNFVYYREHGAKEAGPFNEPPFSSLRHLSDPAWLARQPQEYFLAANRFNNPPKENLQMGDLGNFPKMLIPGQTTTFVFELSPPVGGWLKEGLLRLQTDAVLDGTLKASFNGKPLHPADRKGEFYPNPHPPQLTGPDEAAQSWRVPPDMPHAGENTVEITALTPTPAHAIFLDLALP